MSDPAPPPPDAARLQTPIARLLRPLVRLFIRCGLTFPALSDLLRELYVNVAEYDFALSGKEQTDSRVSLLTGIHRKEVRRLRGAGAPGAARSRQRVALEHDHRALDRRAGIHRRDRRSTAAAARGRRRRGSDLRGPGRIGDAGRTPARRARRVARPRHGRDRRRRAASACRRPLSRRARATTASSIILAATCTITSPRRWRTFSQPSRRSSSAPCITKACRARWRRRCWRLSRGSPPMRCRGSTARRRRLMPSDPGGTWRWNFGLYLFREDEAARDLRRRDRRVRPPTGANARRRRLERRAKCRAADRSCVSWRVSPAARRSPTRSRRASGDNGIGGTG